MNHCGMCGNDCDNDFGVCVSGVCGCEQGLTACGQNNNCLDTTKDPQHCGMCGNDCTPGQTCNNGMCGCQPGFVMVDGSCVDAASSPQNCGGNGVACSGNTPLCENGVCVAQCQNNLDQCQGGCVDFDSDPLHCGECNKPCQSDEFCINGDCREWNVGIGCNTCPCDDCQGDFNTCCPYPGMPSTVACVDSDFCP